MRNGRTRFALALAGLIGLGAAAATMAAEPLDISQSYSGYSASDVAHIVSYNHYANGGGITNSFAIAAGAFSFTDPFLKSSANPPLTTYFLGVSPDVPGTTTVDESAHLVLAVASAFAAGIISGGQDFDTIFSGYSEGGLIDALTLIDTADLDPSDAGYAAQQAAKQQAVRDIFAFSDDLDARLGTAPAFGGPLTLVSFSSGQAIGDAVSLVTTVGSAVPEPASWAMMIGGIGLVGGLARRRGTALTLAA